MKSDTGRFLCAPHTARSFLFGLGHVRASLQGAAPFPTMHFNHSEQTVGRNTEMLHADLCLITGTVRKGIQVQEESHLFSVQRFI